jgi:type I restriction enzyme S subunit
MGDWIDATLGEIADGPQGFIDGPFGSNLPASEYVSAGIPVIRGSNLSLGVSRFVSDEFVYVSRQTAERLVRSQARPNDIIFTKKGTIGQTGLVPNLTKFPKYVLSSNQMRLRVNTSIAEPLFVYYYVSQISSVLKVIQDSEATGVPKTNLTYFRTFPIKLPPLQEQREIALMLGALDDKIELNRRMNETLEAMARAIFKDWFVDFGPVRAKAEGRAPYLASEIWSLFPSCLDGEDKPEGWEWGTVCDLVTFNPPERIASGSISSYLDMAALPTSGSWPNVPIARPFASGSKFRNGDALLARITPCLENGKAAFVQCLNDDQVGWGSTEFIVMRARAPLPGAFAYILARYPAFKAHAVRSMTGTSGRQRVQVDSLGTFPMAKPSESVATAFDDVVTPWFDMIAANSRESETLAALRDLLLPKLMSGEIRVKDAEKAVGEAA